MEATAFFLLYATYFVAICAGGYTFKQSPLIGRLAFASVALSGVIDVISIYYAQHNMNNMHLYNLYELIAYPLEIIILLSTGIFNKTSVYFAAILIFVFYLAHINFNVQHGFDHFSSPLSYISSIFVSLFFAIIIIVLLTKQSNDFEKHKLSFLILGGIFIFELNCSISILKYIPSHDQIDKSLLHKTYFYTVASGNILKNLLFILYFIFITTRLKLTLKPIT